MSIVISLGEQHSFPLDIVFEFVRPATVEEVLTQAVLPAPMFTARWRWNASRALAIPRYAGGRKMPPPIQRMRADDLMAAVFPDQAACPENLSGDVRIPNHPLVRETITNCLYEAMDLHGLRALLEGLHEGAIRTVAVDTPEPSPFSHEILNANPYAYLDDAPLEERRARMVQMRRTLPADQAEDAGALDPAAIAHLAGLAENPAPRQPRPRLSRFPECRSPPRRTPCLIRSRLAMDSPAIWTFGPPFVARQFDVPGYLGDQQYVTERVGQQ